MKHVSEKKQDLLLDALSCIDEDILAKGLALRDGTVIPAEGVSAADAPKSATVTPPLYDLTRRPDKPPKKNPWRVLAVVAAACLLFCVIPLSMWTVGNMSKNESAPMEDDLSGQEGAQNGVTDGASDNGPDDNVDQSPEYEEPIEPEAPDEPQRPAEEVTESTGTVPEDETRFDPHELVWNPATNGADCTAQAHNGAHVELMATFNSSVGASASAEDEMALQMVAQWLLSLYALDYGDHFPLFYESFVQEKFIKEAVGYGLTYTQAIDRMDSVAANLFPVDNVTLILSLEENTLLAGEELETYRATKPAYQTARGFDPELITAVRRVRISGEVEIDGFRPDAAAVWAEIFYLYEYEGEWYLDETLMDDDLSIDLLGTGKADSGFYKMKTTEGKVVAVDDIYLYLDTGDAFRIDGAVVHNQTDGGEWHDVVIYVGDTVSVSHYSFEMEGLTRSVDGEEWTLSTATEVNYLGRAHVHNG